MYFHFHRRFHFQLQWCKNPPRIEHVLLTGRWFHQFLFCDRKVYCLLNWSIFWDQCFFKIKSICNHTSTRLISARVFIITFPFDLKSKRFFFTIPLPPGFQYLSLKWNFKTVCHHPVNHIYFILCHRTNLAWQVPHLIVNFWPWPSHHVEQLPRSLTKVCGLFRCLISRFRIFCQCLSWHFRCVRHSFCQGKRIDEYLQHHRLSEVEAIIYTDLHPIYLLMFPTSSQSNSFIILFLNLHTS